MVLLMSSASRLAATGAWAVPLDPDAATPMYLQVMQGLQAKIEAGELGEGSGLPGERELAGRLGVSRVTVRQALGLLTQRGLLVRKHGSGTFVAPRRIQHAISDLTGFSDDMRARGQTPGARVLNFARTRPTSQESMSLGLAPGAAIYRLRRLRTADAEPLAVEESSLPADLIGTLTPADVTDRSLYAELARRGLAPQRALRQLRAVGATPELATLLAVQVGTALLATERVSWDDQNRAIEFARAYYRGDRYDFVMELKAE